MSDQDSQVRNPTSGPFYVVAAHGGAGYHPPTSDASVNRSLRAAISSALNAFSTTTTSGGGGSSGTSTTTTSTTSELSSTALDAATTVIAALEDAPDFNAGYGSNLTFDGHVECDASLMSSSSSLPSSSFLYGSVGAVRGVWNPVLIARRVLEGRRRRETEMGMRMGMGRVPPLMLVGEGAVEFARVQGVPVGGGGDEEKAQEEEEMMVAPRARREWALWRERCRRWEEEEGEAPMQMQMQMEGVSESGDGDGGEPLCARQDTVGAVVLVDCEADHHGDDGRVAAGVSRYVSFVRAFSSIFRHASAIVS